MLAGYNGEIQNLKVGMKYFGPLGFHNFGQFETLHLTRKEQVIKKMRKKGHGNSYF